MRILSARFANYCLKGSVISLYSHQSRSWCSWEGNSRETEEITNKIPWKRLSAIEEEMKEMRRQMSMMMTKLEEVSVDKQGNHGEVEEMKEMRRQMSMMMTKLEEEAMDKQRSITKQEDDSLKFRKTNTAQNPVDNPQETSPSEGKQEEKGGEFVAWLKFVCNVLLYVLIWSVLLLAIFWVSTFAYERFLIVKLKK
ncbi:PREDICTED: uncharacterized protein LOC104810090 [Tarenaya hassleriana]|uniref:uncharacterized protein LOC104810090 n=1 Tax=Tarenaya hassleriana TaxID=28532 RepID=UPI00053CA61B|nr:PREDICTED: uncharacterized protein LOC104810090 [Tarenaya hassleriana]